MSERHELDATAIVGAAPDDLRDLLYSFRIYGRFLADSWIDAGDSAVQICRKLFVCILLIDCVPSLAWLIYLAAFGAGIGVAPSSSFSAVPLAVNGGASSIVILVCFLAVGVLNFSAFIFLTSLERTTVNNKSSGTNQKEQPRQQDQIASVPSRVYEALLMTQVVFSAAHGWALGYDVGASIMAVRIGGLCCIASLGRAKHLGIVLFAAVALLAVSAGHMGSSQMRRSVLEQLWPPAVAHAVLLFVLHALLIRDVWLVQHWPAINVADQTWVLEELVRGLVTSAAAMAEVGAGPGSSKAKDPSAMWALCNSMKKSSKEFYSLVDRMEDAQLACSLLLLRNQLVEASVLNRSSAVATAALASTTGADVAGDSGCLSRRPSEGGLSRRSSGYFEDRARRATLTGSEISGGEASSPPGFNRSRRRSSAMLHAQTGGGGSGPDSRRLSFTDGADKPASSAQRSNQRTACLLVLHSANARRAVSEAAEMEELLATIASQNGGFLHQGSTTLRAVVSWNAVAEQQYMFENHVANAVLSLKHRCRNFFYGVALTGQATSPCPRTVSILSDNWAESRLHAELMREAEAQRTILIDYSTAIASFDFQIDLVDIFSRELQGSVIGATLEGLKSSKRLAPLFSVVREARGDTNEKAVEAARYLVQGKWLDLNQLLQEYAEVLQSGEPRSNHVLDADDDIIQALDELVQVNLAPHQAAVTGAFGDVPFVVEEET